MKVIREIVSWLKMTIVWLQKSWRNWKKQLEEALFPKFEWKKEKMPSLWRSRTGVSNTRVARGSNAVHNACKKRSFFAYFSIFGWNSETLLTSSFWPPRSIFFMSHDSLKRQIELKTPDLDWVEMPKSLKAGGFLKNLKEWKL
jgi:hypothetical protein